GRRSTPATSRARVLLSAAARRRLCGPERSPAWAPADCMAALECRQPSRGQETRRRAEGCRTTSGTRSVTDHEPGRWRGLSLDQRRTTPEALTGARLVLAAPTGEHV